MIFIFRLPILIFILASLKSYSSDCFQGSVHYRASCNEIIFNKCITENIQKNKAKTSYEDKLFEKYLKKNDLFNKYKKCREKGLREKILNDLGKNIQAIKSMDINNITLKDILSGKDLEQLTPMKVVDGVFSLNPMHKWKKASKEGYNLSDIYFQNLRNWRSLISSERNEQFYKENPLILLLDSKRKNDKKLITMKKSEVQAFPRLLNFFHQAGVNQISFKSRSEVYVLVGLLREIGDLKKFIKWSAQIYMEAFVSELKGINEKPNPAQYIINNLGKFEYSRDWINYAMEDCRYSELGNFRNQLKLQLESEEEWGEMWTAIEKRFYTGDKETAKKGVLNQFIGFINDQWEFSTNEHSIDTILNVFNRNPISGITQSDLESYLKKISIRFGNGGYIFDHAYSYSLGDNKVNIGINDVYDIYSKGDWLLFDMIMAHELAHAVQNFFHNKKGTVSPQSLGSYENIVKTCFKKEDHLTEDEDMADFWASNFMTFLRKNQLNKENSESIFNFFCRSEIGIDEAMFFYNKFDIFLDEHTVGYERIFNFFNHSREMQKNFNCNPEYYCVY